MFNLFRICDIYAKDDGSEVYYIVIVQNNQVKFERLKVHYLISLLYCSISIIKMPYLTEL